MKLTNLELLEEFKQTINKERFLINKDYTKGMIYASDEGLEILSHCKKIFADGTFYSTPEDFENAAINAFKYAFPGIKCKGCHFHYCQALWQKMVELDMKKSYEEDYELRDWLRLFMALPLVPVELVKNAYDEILNCKPAITNKDLRSSVQRYLKLLKIRRTNFKKHKK